MLCLYIYIMAVTLTNALPELISANETNNQNVSNNYNETFDFSYWSKMDIDFSYVECTQELYFDFGDQRLLLQTSDNIKYILMRCRQAQVMRDVFFLTALIVGIPANILALAAMLTLRPRSIPTFYVALLSASDLTALALRGIDYIIVRNQVEIPRLLCGLKVSLVDFSASYANWVLVLICFERFYTLRFPLSKMAHFTFGRAKLLAALMAILPFPYYLARMFLQGEPTMGYCAIEDQDIAYLMLKIDDVLYLYAPFCLLFIFVALIARELHIAQKTRQKMFHTNSLQASQENEGNKSNRTSTATVGDTSEQRLTTGAMLNEQTSRQLRQQQKNERSLTIMMFCAAIFFLVMTLPFCVIQRFYFHPFTGVKAADLSFHLVWAHGLLILTHVSNFFLYFITCRRLRSHLWQMLRLKKLHKLCCCPSCAHIPFCVDNRRPSVSSPDVEQTKISRIPLATLDDD